MEKTLNSISNKSSTTNWDLSFYKINSNTNIPDPYGFNTNIIESLDQRTKRKDINQVKLQKAQELAYGQFKNVFMTLLSFYFIGSSLSLITIFIVGLYGYNSMTSILNVGNVFKPFESPENSIIQYKLVYVLIQSVTFFFVLYRIYGLGLIPLNPADWISLIDTKLPNNHILSI
jgi:hypothetical protein